MIKESNEKSTELGRKVFDYYGTIISQENTGTEILNGAFGFFLNVLGALKAPPEVAYELAEKISQYLQARKEKESRDQKDE